LSVPSVRSLFVCAKVRSRFLLRRASASAVAWWTIASGDLDYRLPHRVPVEQVERDRIRAERADSLGASGRPESAGHLVPPIDQLGDEPAADRPARTYDEDSHRLSPFGHIRGMCRVSGV
jgi:hypothetical protein